MQIISLVIVEDVFGQASAMSSQLLDVPGKVSNAACLATLKFSSYDNDFGLLRMLIETGKAVCVGMVPMVRVQSPREASLFC